MMIMLPFATSSSGAAVYNAAAFHSGLLHLAVEHTGVFASDGSSRQGCRVAAYAALQFEAMPNLAMDAARAHASYKNDVYAVHFGGVQAATPVVRDATAPLASYAETRRSEAYEAVRELQNIAAEYNMVSNKCVHGPGHRADVYNAVYCDIAAEHDVDNTQQHLRSHAHVYKNAHMNNSANVAASYGLLQPDSLNLSTRATAAVYALYEKTVRAHQLLHSFGVVRSAGSESHRSGVYASTAAVTSASIAHQHHTTGCNVALRHSVYATRPQAHIETHAAVSSDRIAAYSGLNAHHSMHNIAAVAASPARQTVYATLENERAHSHESTSNAYSPNTTRMDVYTANNADSSKYQAPVRERPPVAYKSSVYSVMDVTTSINAARRVSTALKHSSTTPLARTHTRSTSSSSRLRAVNSTPSTPPATRRTQTESNASLKSAGGSSTNLTALVHGSMIRSTSHNDLQKIVNVSLSSLSEEFEFGTIAAPIAAAGAPAHKPRSPGSPTTRLQRAGHLASLSLVGRMQKLGC